MIDKTWVISKLYFKVIEVILKLFKWFWSYWSDFEVIEVISSLYENELNNQLKK